MAKNKEKPLINKGNEETITEIEIFSEELQDGKIRLVFYKSVKIFINDYQVYPKC